MSTPKGPHGGLSDFNIHHGFIESLIRGMRCSFLKDADYHHITQCENLEDVKLNLSETDYSDAVADMTVLTPSDLQAAAIKKVSILRCFVGNTRCAAHYCRIGSSPEFLLCLDTGFLGGMLEFF